MPLPRKSAILTVFGTNQCTLIYLRLIYLRGTVYKITQERIHVGHDNIIFDRIRILDRSDNIGFIRLDILQGVPKPLRHFSG